MTRSAYHVSRSPSRPARTCAPTSEQRLHVPSATRNITMRLTHAYRLTTLRHAHQFLVDHAEQLPEVVETGACRRLDAIVADLLPIVAEQSAAILQGRGATQRCMWSDAASSKTTSPRSSLSRAPSSQGHRRWHRFASLPEARPSNASPALRTALAQAAAPHAPVFIAAGLPHEFPRSCESGSGRPRRGTSGTRPVPGSASR